MYLDSRPQIFLWSECCSFEHLGIRLPAFLKRLAHAVTEVQTPAGFCGSRTRPIIKISRGISIHLITLLSFHGSWWLYNTKVLEVVHGRVGNLEEIVLVLYGISFALPGFLYQNKIDGSMKNLKFLSEISYLVLFM